MTTTARLTKQKLLTWMEKKWLQVMKTARLTKVTEYVTEINDDEHLINV